MAIPLPPDPYKILGVARDAKLPEIRSAHRKLVLKCHPDKVQDEALKAIKQDEFQKVQQAYELLSDDNRRIQYDEGAKLFEIRNDLRREMGRNSAPAGPPPGTSFFDSDYEVRTAEPRNSTFKSKPKESPRFHEQRTSSRSFDDDLSSRAMYDEPPRATARKTASYEDRKRPPLSKEEEKRSRKSEEKERERWEKDSKRSALGAAKKSRDKERKKDSEHKYRTYIEDDESEDGYRPSKPEKKTSSRRSDEEAKSKSKSKSREEKRNEDAILTERTRKLHIQEDIAAQYLQASRRKVDMDADFRPKPIRRAETFQDASFTSRHTFPSPLFTTVEEDDYVRRSSARPSVRRASHDIPIRTREPRTTRPSSPEPYIVEASPPSMKKPTLHSHSSAPPIIQEASRKEPHRSKTLQPQYTSRRESNAAPPPLPRAATFQAGDRGKTSTSRGSKLKKPLVYKSDASDLDVPEYSPPRAHSPPPPRRREPESTRYIIDKNRTVHLREGDYTDPRDRERSESPRGGRRDRPPISRTSGSSNVRASSSTRSPSSYFPTKTTSPEPVIVSARTPKGPVRENSAGIAHGSSPHIFDNRYSPAYGGPVRDNSSGAARSSVPNIFEGKYSPASGPDYSKFTDESYRRGSDPPTRHAPPSQEYNYTSSPRAAYA